MGKECKCLTCSGFLKQKICCKSTLQKYSELIDIERLYLFFQLLNQQSDALNSVTPNAFANSKAFSFIMIPSVGIFGFYFRQTSCIHVALSTFSQFPQRVFFREEFIPFFPTKLLICVFLTHVEIVFCGTPYFVATSLFDNPFSRSFKALHFSAKDLFVSFRFTGVIFLKKTFDEKRKTYVMYFFLPKN